MVREYPRVVQLRLAALIGRALCVPHFASRGLCLHKGTQSRAEHAAAEREEQG